MRLPDAALACVLLATALKDVVSFSISNPHALHPVRTNGHHAARSATWTQLSSTEVTKEPDDYDDWYADFDPSEWEDAASNVMSEGNNGRRHSRKGGGRHDYVRDVSADNSNIDVAAVDSLLSERLQARKTGQFDLADEIRDTLLQNYGVTVWDREKTWRSGCSKSGSGMRNPGSRRKLDRPRKSQDFGPLGHDYSKSDDAGDSVTTLSEVETHERIAERLQCKLNRDFKAADSIQASLADKGVFLHDGRKEWRADGVPFGDFNRGNTPNPSRERGSRSSLGPNGHDYYLSRDAGPITSALSENEIHSLIAERLQCKMNRNFVEADQIQEELISNGVFVHDKRKEWRADGNAFENLSDDRGRDSRRDKASGPYKYSQSRFSDSLPSEDTLTVENLVSRRSSARNERDYDAADDLLDQLEADWNVKVDDKRCEWSVGGTFGGHETPSSKEWVRRGGGDLSEKDIYTITSMLSKRTEAKKARNFRTADSIRDELRDTYSVSVDDFSFEWRVLSNEYVPSGNPSLDAETISYIQERLARRMKAKQDRDYDVADSIRDELREQFSVTVDDRTREWTVNHSNGVDVSSDSSLESLPDGNIDAELESILNNDDGDNSDDIAVQSSGDYSSLTVSQLKDKLREAGQPVSGRKAELISRLSGM